MVFETVLLPKATLYCYPFSKYSFIQLFCVTSSFLGNWLSRCLGRVQPTFRIARHVLKRISFEPYLWDSYCQQTLRCNITNISSVHIWNYLQECVLQLICRDLLLSQCFEQNMCLVYSHGRCLRLHFRMWYQALLAICLASAKE